MASSETTRADLDQAISKASQIGPVFYIYGLEGSGQPTGGRSFGVSRRINFKTYESCDQTG
jgi:hypothetical protein